MLAEFTEKFLLYWEFPFVRYALIAGVMIALCSSLLGVTLVLKRFSFIGDGLSHVAFGALSVASVMKLGFDMPIVLLVTVLSAVMLLKTGRRCSSRNDFRKFTCLRLHGHEYFLGLIKSFG